MTMARLNRGGRVEASVLGNIAFVRFADGSVRIHKVATPEQAIWIEAADVEDLLAVTWAADKRRKETR